MSVFTFSHLEKSVEEMTHLVRRPDFLTYFKKFTLIDVTANIVTLGVVTTFAKDNLSKKFYSQIKEAIQKVAPEIEVVDFVVDERIEIRPREEVVECKLMLTKAEKQIKKEQVQGVEVVNGVKSRMLADRYQLSNFVAGQSTELAYAACQAVARKPGTPSYNPLYIYGNVGLGKTHLLQGTANAIKAKYKNLRVAYMTADKFITDYVASIQSKTIEKLLNQYRELDVLVLDDVQFLAGKKQIQEGLYNIFNILYDAGKQIILSGDRSPKELTILEPRLQSRFGAGIMADVNAPEYETRLAILQEKARAREFLLPQDVAELIAENVTENVRELEGILNQIIAEQDLRGTPPTIENVAIRLSKLSITPLTTSTTTSRSFRSTSSCSYEDLIQEVSLHFGVEMKAILSENRQKENMIPRQIAMYLLKNRLNFTYERIGNIFSGRNHTAVMYSCKKLEKVMKKDQQLVYELNMIRDKLGI